MSKTVHRVTKLIDRHEDRCDRQHTKLKAEIVNAFLRATAPYFTEEQTDIIRRAMVTNLARRKH